MTLAWQSTSRRNPRPLANGKRRKLGSFFDLRILSRTTPKRRRRDSRKQQPSGEDDLSTIENAGVQPVLAEKEHTRHNLQPNNTGCASGCRVPEEMIRVRRIAASGLNWTVIEADWGLGESFGIVSCDRRCRIHWPLDRRGVAGSR